MSHLIKTFSVSLFILLNSLLLFGQNEFDQQLQKLSDDLAAKIALKSKAKIAVWDFTDLEGNATTLGKYIAEDVSINLVNSSYGFRMVNRNQLQTIIKENRLRSDGFIDQRTSQQMWKLAQVGIIVTGTTSVLNEKIKLTIQAFDTSGNVIAATKGDVIMNDDVRELLGVSTNNKGFNNRPLNSDETYNNPETVNSDCAQKNTGDYCFMNDRGLKVEVRLTKEIWRQDITLQPSQTQCYYTLEVGTYSYYAFEYSNQANAFNARGFINVEQCKSKTFVIK